MLRFDIRFGFFRLQNLNVADFFRFRFFRFFQIRIFQIFSDSENLNLHHFSLCKYSDSDFSEFFRFFQNLNFSDFLRF